MLVLLRPLGPCTPARKSRHGALGFNTEGWVGDLPLVIAFAILAAYTYTSGLRAPAAIAIIKDTLIYLTIIVIPLKLGGFSNIFAAVLPDKLLLKPPDAASMNGFSAYATLAFGSALALFLYPHSVTAILSSQSGSTVRRNMALLPAYTLVLGLLALLGFMALAAGVNKLPEYASYFARYATNFAVPALLMSMFPSWFLGIALAAIGIGALVPAAIMSIAAANLYARNIHRVYFQPQIDHHRETQIAKLGSLVVKLGALAFIIFLPLQYAIQLQLLGGIWIIQTLPAIVFGLYTRWLDHRALLLGRLVGLASGTWMACTLAFKSTNYALHLGSYAIPGYAAVYSLILNIVVAVIATEVVRVLHLPPGRDETEPADYLEPSRAAA